MKPERGYEWPYYMPGGMREQLGRPTNKTAPGTRIPTAAEPELTVLYGARGEVLKTFGGPRPIGFRRT